MASKRRLRRKVCDRKKRHATQGQAVGLLIRLKAEGRLDAAHRTYLCPVCNGWHIGRWNGHSEPYAMRKLRRGRP